MGGYKKTCRHKKTYHFQGKKWERTSHFLDLYKKRTGYSSAKRAISKPPPLCDAFLCRNVNGASVRRGKQKEYKSIKKTESNGVQPRYVDSRVFIY